jgi:aminobenzoyl-glutamate utilization protein B
LNRAGFKKSTTKEQVMRTQLEAAIAGRAATCHAVSDAIWDFAELGFTEEKSSALLEDLLEKEGFHLRRGVSGMPSAFTAEAVIGGGGPVIGFLAEYDALPLLSQKALCAARQPELPAGPGHGCGHNAMGAMQALAACSLKETLERNGLSAVLRVFGTPAEELLAGKAFLARDHEFDGLDAVLDCHANAFFSTSFGEENNALFSFVVTFKGLAAHAGSRPWEGRSAADAVELMHAGTERLREHMLPEQRIHWVTLNGVSAPNVVPDLSSTWYYARGRDDAIRDLYARILDCARGAALMAGVSYETRLLGACHQRFSNQALAGAMYANMLKAGVPVYSREENTFALELQKTMGAPEIGLEMRTFITDASLAPFRGDSSDVGDVTLNAPTATLQFPAWAPGARAHHWSVTACMKSGLTHKGMNVAALVQGLTALDIILKPDLRAAMAGEFARLRAVRPYVSFLGAADKPPLDWYAEDMKKFAALREKNRQGL